MVDTIKLSVISRHPCPLCDHLILALEVLRPRLGFTYERIDVDADPQLQQQFGDKVPVLLHGNTEICWGHCDPMAIASYLDSAGADPSLSQTPSNTHVGAGSN